MKKANEHLKNERKSRGWTRGHVAEMIGSDAHTVGRWERGDTFPSPYYLQKLCELYGKKAEELGLLKDDTNGSAESYAGRTMVMHQSPASPLLKETLQTGADPTVQGISSSGILVPVQQTVSVPEVRGRSRSGIIVKLSVIVVLLSLMFAVWRLWLSPVSSGVGRSSPGVLATSTVLRQGRFLGGQWLMPAEGQIVGNIIEFAAHAYATSQSSPPVARVIFTAHIRGKWKVACIAYQLANSDIFKCSVNLKELGAIAGQLLLNFDVFDQQNHVKHSADGGRSIVYSPVG